MLYLVLATCVTLVMVFTFKVVHVKRWNAKHATLINYIVAFAITLGVVIQKKLLPAFTKIASVNFETLLSEHSLGNTMFLIMVSGVVIGIFYVLNIMLIDSSVLVNGSGMTTLFGRSGFLLTIMVSVLLLGESVTPLRIIGVCMTLTALLIASGVGSKSARVRNPLILFSMTFVVGVVEILNKAFTLFATSEYMSCLMLVTFFISLIIYTSLCFYWGKKDSFFRIWKWQEIVAGIFMGIPNAFGNIFQILALENLPTSIVYPSIASGNLLVASILSRYVFKEELGTRKLLAVTLTVISLILVNIILK